MVYFLRALEADFSVISRRVFNSRVGLRGDCFSILESEFTKVAVCLPEKLGRRAATERPDGSFGSKAGGSLDKRTRGSLVRRWR